MGKLRGPNRADGHRKFNPISVPVKTSADKEAEEELRIHLEKGVKPAPTVQTTRTSNVKGNSVGTQVSGSMNITGGSQ